MSRGYKPIKAKADGKDDTDKYFINSMNHYCNGRGCRHGNMPDFKPTAVCFYIKGSETSHKDILERFQDILPMCPGTKILQIQFVPLGVHLDKPGTENRWNITLNSTEARNRLAGTSVHIRGQRVTLRRYDDIIQLEYRKCSSKSIQLQSMLKQTANQDSNLSGKEAPIDVSRN